MSEDSDKNPELIKKSECPPKETPKEDKDKTSENNNITEQTENNTDQKLDEQSQSPSKENQNGDKEKISNNNNIIEEASSNSGTKLGKKSQSPSKIIIKDDKEKIKHNKNMTEQNSNKSRTFVLEKLTEDFVEEEEQDGVNIKYKEQDKKIKLITLDLLFKKIVKENFLEKNPVLIYSFCQQCFCFLDKKILFNKIINCYNYYKEKKTPIEQIRNILKFLNILIIEMYEYYTKIKIDDPFLTLIKNFYDVLFLEMTELINERKRKAEEEENLNVNDFQNKLEEFNEDEEEKNEINVFKDRNSELLTEDITRSGTIAKKEGSMSSSLFNEDEKGSSDRNTVNITRTVYEKEDKKKKKKEEKEKKKKEKEQKKKEKAEKGKKGILHFFGQKKEKPVKIENKDQKNDAQKEKDDDLKLKLIQQYKNATPTNPEEEILNTLFNIMPLFSTEEPNIALLKQAKKHIDFYKDLKGKLAEIIGKPLPQEPPKKHIMAKSQTVNNVNKKSNQLKLKLHDNDGYFDVLDWDEKEIGEKLIAISKKSINKVQRSEIYKAIFLKKDKEKTSPNVVENIDKFNKLTFFIIEDILSYDFAKHRAKIMDRWILIAEYCKERKDYNDCVAIFSALNNYIIAGLKKTNDEMKSKASFKQLKKFCRYQGNYKKIREDMKSLSINDFYVPYLGMILKDLAFYEENSKYIENEVLINMEKLENVQIAVTDFFNCKNTVDKVKIPIPEELDFFDHLEEIKESKMEELANDLEPEFKIKEYANKKKEKRLTNIDKKYFFDSTVKRPNMRDSKRFELQKKALQKK